jgi:hypothetical protein
MKFVLSGERDCQAVLESLSRILERYGFVHVENVKTLIGQPCVYVDHKLGWVDLSDVNISHVEDGWQLTFPDPVKEVDVLSLRAVDKVMKKLRDAGFVTEDGEYFYQSRG